MKNSYHNYDNSSKNIPFYSNNFSTKNSTVLPKAGIVSRKNSFSNSSNSLNLNKTGSFGGNGNSFFSAVGPTTFSS